MKQLEFRSRAVFLVMVSLMAAGLLVARADPLPLTRAHAHNDYEHKHPLTDALEQGFCSVEADINLVDGKLLVAHSPKATDPRRTLESLYLTPLRARIKENGGRVYRDGPECTLLIDFKTDAAPTYAALREVLQQYADILAVFRDGRKEDGKPLMAVLTGNYPRKLLEDDKVRYAAGDGKLKDLDTNPPADLVPWISENWQPLFQWRGSGAMPAEDRSKIKDILRRAHEQGRRVRFWNAPDKASAWKEFLEQGVDLINTDDLKGFARFYTGQ